MIFVTNVSEDDIATGNQYVDQVKEYAEKLGSEVVIVSAKVEEELQEMEEADKVKAKEEAKNKKNIEWKDPR